MVVPPGGCADTWFLTIAGKYFMLDPLELHMRILPFLFALVMAGCATIGREIDPEAFGKFQVGVTTELECLTVSGNV